MIDMNILLVDDEHRSRLHVANFLRKLGHMVMEASDGREALELFPSHEFDLILTDHRMPRMSGLELLQEIRSLAPVHDPHMVVFTAYGDMQNTVMAMRAGASDYLLKPLNIDELVTMIERIARQRADRQKLTVPDPNAEQNTSVPAGKNLSGYIRKKFAPNISLNEIGVFSTAMHKAYELAQKLHDNRLIPVLIEGETGTGKELVARFIHYGEEDNPLPFIALNCAALNANIFESELFGYEPGAFSGGLSSGNKGKLDMAEGGTLFLDEISEIPINLQAKLLRMLQEKEYYRVGGLKLIKTDVRIVCASNKNLEEAVRQGVFRQDLYYRLNVGHIFVPPLRERREDILPLSRLFLKEFSRQYGKRFIRINPQAADLLLAYAWPGNVRELRNIMEWVVLMGDEDEVTLQHLEIIGAKRAQQIKDHYSPFEPDSETLSLPVENTSLNKLSNSIILKALEMHHGNKTETARYLNISRSSLYNRLRQIQEDHPQPKYSE